MARIAVGAVAATAVLPIIGTNSGLTLPDVGSKADAITGVFIAALEVPVEYCWNPARPKPSPLNPKGVRPNPWAYAALKAIQPSNAIRKRCTAYHHTQENLWPVVAAIIETAWLLPNPGGVV
jgi:hypothetical protein